MVTTIDGWIKPHALAIWRLVTLASISQKGQRNLILSSTKEKTRLILNTLEERWTKHWRKEMEVAHQMEKSIHLIGQVVTPHQTKKKEVCKIDI